LREALEKVKSKMTEKNKTMVQRHGFSLSGSDKIRLKKIRQSIVKKLKVVVSGVIIVYVYTLLSGVTSVVYFAPYLFNRN
jgi:hypothetical protein